MAPGLSHCPVERMLFKVHLSDVRICLAEPDRLSVLPSVNGLLRQSVHVLIIMACSSKMQYCPISASIIYTQILCGMSLDGGIPDRIWYDGHWLLMQAWD